MNVVRVVLNACTLGDGAASGSHRHHWNLTRCVEPWVKAAIVGLDGSHSSQDGVHPATQPVHLGSRGDASDPATLVGRGAHVTFRRLGPLGNHVRSRVVGPGEVGRIEPISAEMRHVHHVNAVLLKKDRATLSGRVRVFGGVDHPANTSLQNAFGTRRRASMVVARLECDHQRAVVGLAASLVKGDDFSVRVSGLDVATLSDALP